MSKTLEDLIVEKLSTASPERRSAKELRRDADRLLDQINRFNEAFGLEALPVRTSAKKVRQIR